MLLGLTGGISTGKSMISKYLSELEFPIVDADKIAHQVLESDLSVISAIKEQFGSDVAGIKGIDRKKLGQIVFGSEARLRELNQIIQPAIRTKIVNEIKTLNQNHNLVVLDAPLLFEEGYAGMVDVVMVVTSDESIQLSRLMRRNKLTQADARKRITAQMPLQQKVKHADIVIDNSGTVADTQKQVLKWLVDNKLVDIRKN
ncbi:dephospho-CoA kinase [Pediococcus argentinicus]|uniref:Dephospho-CoA kinase n=1 Tax=Pediococcus argentinicus TaxID=480391 RepID=A0A0R2NHT2_9LACO|nr:dephospho-CoA kinase [Pediococcus argentinicus]KRO25351.1 coaE protein [Pediococcus argentinicus]NKZ22269.1 dephospho-CoA kinase [Pediococcus argentinicus]GEP19366.1 dephospho-CoA kinase [Pediococcus argentinicus]